MDSRISNAYVISLDALNLGFMEERFEKRLYNKDLELSSNIYQKFEVRQNEDIGGNEGNNDDIHIPCYICEIEVPHQFYYEHKNSIIHEMNLRIINIAVQRLRKHLNYQHQCDLNNTSSSSSLFQNFCPVCVVCVNNSENTHHYNSVEHKNSIIDEKVLTEFLSIYSKVINYSDSVKSDNNANCIVKMDHKQDKLDILINKEPQKQKSGIKLSVNKSKKHNTDLASYIDFLKNNYNSPEMRIIVCDENTIEITTLDGSVLRINSERFHGFKELEGYTTCLICLENFDTSLRDQHILSDRHIKLVWNLPLKDKNCMRFVNDSWCHCVLCNVRVENCITHHSTLEHLNNMKLLLQSENLLTYNKLNSSNCVNFENQDHESNCTNTQNINTIKPAQKLLEMATTNQPNLRTENVDEKLDTNKHKIGVCEQEKLFCICCHKFITSKGFKKHCKTASHSMNALSEYHYLLTVIDTDFLCKVCGFIVENNIEKIRQHVALPLHLHKYELLLNANGIIKINELTLYCTLCNIPLLIKNEITHLNSKLHIEHTDKNASADTENSIATNNSIPLQAELNSQSQKTAENVQFQYFFCDICNVKVPNSKNNIETHINGRSHTKKVQKLFDQNSGIKEDNSKTDHALHKLDINTESIAECKPSKLDTVYYLQKTDGSTLKCLVCEVYITNNKNNISIHCQGLNHKNNYTAMIERNQFVINNKVIFCRFCQVHISIGNEVDHSNGKTHRKNLEEITVACS